MTNGSAEINQEIMDLLECKNADHFWWRPKWRKMKICKFVNVVEETILKRFSKPNLKVNQIYNSGNKIVVDIAGILGSSRALCTENAI